MIKPRKKRAEERAERKSVSCATHPTKSTNAGLHPGLTSPHHDLEQPGSYLRDQVERC